jgi:hypothetical protein
MSDNVSPIDRARNSVLSSLVTRPHEEERAESQTPDELSCPAFGFLRGLHDRGLAIEFRLRSGNSAFYPYSWLGPVIFDPSVGLLLRFTGDTTTLVLIRGSNLSAPVRQNAVNLTDRGLQRHRITYVREMDKEELRKAGDGEPTIDAIAIAEFETHEEAQEWLTKHAPALVRKLP